MRVLICGTNTEKAVKYFKSAVGDNVPTITYRLPIPNFTESITDDYSKKLIEFAQVCQLGYVPGCINIYTTCPWLMQSIWRSKLTNEQNMVLTTYYDMVGWQPDVVIHLYGATYDQALEECLDVDNQEGVKIFKLNGNEHQLADNLLLIYERVLTHFPKNKLLAL